MAAAEQPIFYYDLSSPEAYLAAERSAGVLGEVPEWQPVWLGGLRAGEVGPFRCAAEIDAYREDIARRAAHYGLQPLRWPPDFPPDAEWAMLVATYAKQIGRAVAFSLAAFRQAYAAGRDLSDPDTVMLAAAAISTLSRSPRSRPPANACRNAASEKATARPICFAYVAASSANSVSAGNGSGQRVGCSP